MPFSSMAVSSKPKAAEGADGALEHEADTAARAIPQGQSVAVRVHSSKRRLQRQRTGKATPQEIEQALREDYIKLARAKIDELKEALENGYIWWFEGETGATQQSVVSIEARRTALRSLVHYLGDLIVRLERGEKYGELREPFLGWLIDKGKIRRVVYPPMTYVTLMAPLEQLLEEKYKIDMWHSMQFSIGGKDMPLHGYVFYHADRTPILPAQPSETATPAAPVAPASAKQTPEPPATEKEAPAAPAAKSQAPEPTIGEPQ